MIFLKIRVFSNYIYVQVYVHACLQSYQRKLMRSHFSPSTMWVIQNKQKGWVTCWAMCLGSFYLYNSFGMVILFLRLLSILYPSKTYKLWIKSIQKLPKTKLKHVPCLLFTLGTAGPTAPPVPAKAAYREQLVVVTVSRSLLRHRYMFPLLELLSSTGSHRPFGHHNSHEGNIFWGNIGTGRVTLSCYGCSSMLTPRLGHNLGSRLAHHEPTKLSFQSHGAFTLNPEIH